MEGSSLTSLEDQVAFYAAYHQDGRNKATHFIGVPAIMLSLFIPLAWLRVDLGGVTLTAAMALAAAVMAVVTIARYEAAMERTRQACDTAAALDLAAFTRLCHDAGYQQVVIKP